MNLRDSRQNALALVGGLQAGITANNASLALSESRIAEAVRASHERISDNARTLFSALFGQKTAAAVEQYHAAMLVAEERGELLPNEEELAAVAQVPVFSAGTSTTPRRAIRL